MELIIHADFWTWRARATLHWICLLPRNWKYRFTFIESLPKLRNGYRTSRTLHRKHWSSVRISGRLRDCTTSFPPENRIIAAKPCFSELESRSSRLETQSVIESRGSSRDCQLKACLQGEREGHPCARVTLASGLKLALVYKQTSQVGLPYHPGQLYQLYWRVSSCVTFFVTSKIGSSLRKIPHI